MRIRRVSVLLQIVVSLVALVGVHHHVHGLNESSALMTLKKGFGDPRSLSNWSSSSPCRGWVGVACDRNSHVISLNVTGLCQTQTSCYLDSAIQDLPYLQNLILSDNNLVGSIPAEISQLVSLTTLDLSHNKLAGDLSNIVWSNLTKLQTLSLHHNGLSGQILLQLMDSSSLMRLDLEDNNFSGGIPPEIFKRLSLLNYFAIDNNMITGAIPDTIGYCASLTSFSASHNQLSGLLPFSIGDLNQLQRFVINDNNLTGRLDPLGKLNLTEFDAAQDQFTGEIPASLSKFNASAFAGNPSLCGLPLTNACSPSQLDRSKSPNSERRRRPHPSGKIVAAIVGGTAGVVLLILVLVCVAVRYSKKKEEEDQALNWFDGGIQDARRHAKYSAFRPSFNRHTYDEIVAYAGHFDTAHVIGRGRFATVYKSVVPEGGIVIAVKVFKNSNMSADFEKELDMLAFLKHKNLLCIRAFYLNPLEKAILYEYLPMGTVHSLLHQQADSSRSMNNMKHHKRFSDWSVRHKVALGVARAMVYLHGKKVIHEDLKPSNILLQEDFEPKVSDFGLIRMVSGRGAANQVVETPGYTAPEVLRSNKYTEKSDVYSYGVVLMELITGQEPVKYVREKEVRMVDWVVSMYKDGKGRAAMDPVMLKLCHWPEYIDKALSLAVWCVDDTPNHRPSMAEVALVLEGLCPVLSPLRSPDFTGEKPLLSFPS